MTYGCRCSFYCGELGISLWTTRYTHNMASLSEPLLAKVHLTIAVNFTWTWCLHSSPGSASEAHIALQCCGKSKRRGVPRAWRMLNEAGAGEGPCKGMLVGSTGWPGGSHVMGPFEDPHVLQFGLPLGDSLSLAFGPRKSPDRRILSGLLAV